MIPKSILSTLLVALFVLVGCDAAAVPKYTYSLPSDNQESSHDAEFYQGHKVIRVKNPSHDVLAAISSHGYDRWGHGQGYVDLRVSPDSDALATLTQAAGRTLDVVTVVENVQDILDKERADRCAGRESAGDDDGEGDLYAPGTWFQDYRRYPQIVEFVQRVCAQRTDVCEFTPSIGKSTEGRDLVSLKLGRRSNKGAKPQIFLSGTQHAREWASTTTVQWIINQLVTNYGKDARITKVLDTVDIHVVPVGNPDGYEYTHSGRRLWRKNRRNNGGGSYGVDLNRNWDYHWGGTSQNPRSETYEGPSAASEPEVKALSGLFDSLPHAVAAIDMHTYSQLLLRPYGDSGDDTPDEKNYLEVTQNMARTIKSVHGKVYQPLKSYDLNPNTGSAKDYFYVVTKSLPGAESTKIHPYGLTLELRPADSWGGGGFILPKEQIVPLGEEILPAFLVYVEHAVRSPLVIQ